MIIDAHTHLPSPGWEGHSCFFTTVESAVEYLRKTGINAALFNTWQGVFAETEDDINSANTAALDLYKNYKGFLYPGAVIHPLFPEISRHWLDRFRAILSLMNQRGCHFLNTAQDTGTLYNCMLARALVTLPPDSLICRLFVRT